MRHTKKTIKLGRKSEHRNLLLANQVCSLIEHSRIRTTLAKAKAVRPFAERMVTLGKRNDLHARRLAFTSDSALMAYIEWVDQPMVEEKPVAEKETTAKK